MKNIKKLFALLIAMVMVLGMSATVFAQTVAYTGSDAGTAKITITNAANGETYKVSKLFNATVTGTTDGSIAYSGTIPSTLSSYFTADSAGNISATAALDLSDSTVQAALKTWAEANVTKSAVSDGSELEFTNLPFGYYIITTTQGQALLTVDSTNPNASVIDKNTTPPINEPSKSADDDDVFIGQTVTYTVKFKTANYSTENGGSKQIVKYTISDNFASGALKDVKVTAITVDDAAVSTKVNFSDAASTALTTPFDWASGKTIEVAWVDANGKSVYANKAELKITYTATVADSAAIDGAGNKNTVTLDYVDEDGNGSPSQKTVDETIFTYALALKKVKQNGEALDGATFQLPFYVKETPDTDGAYIYAGTTAGQGLTNSLTTPANTGLIIIKGVAQGNYSFTETQAPNGYNKLTDDVVITATKTGQTTTSTTTYLDKDGNVVDQATTDGSTVYVTINELAASAKVVVNKTGAELPATGGMGTTIFYVLGSILVIGAGVVMVSRRRMNMN